MTVLASQQNAQEKVQVRVALRDLSANQAWALGVVVCLVSLWIKSGIPLVAAPIAYHDDQFFLRTAEFLLRGQWLGPYDKMTLSKGMFYPLFIVGSFAVSVPLKIAEHLVYLGASGLTALVAARASRRKWVGLVTLAGLAFNPVLWNHWLARVSREGLYTALSLGLFALVVLVSFPELRKAQRNIALGLGFGLVWGAFWLTREESIWLLPACFIPIVLGVGKVVAERRSGSRSSVGTIELSSELRPIVLPLVIGFVVCLAMIGSVAGMNRRYYGVFRTNEFRSGGFVRAYGALSRIKPSHFQRFVSVPIEAREKAYKFSPAAKELSGSLDGQQGHGWANFGCSVHPITPPCDLQVGWLTWALRDAASEAGHYSSAKESEAFYARVATEINNACDSGKIQCLPARETIMPPFRWEYVGETLHSATGLATMVLDMGKGEVGAVPSVGPPQGLASFADITNEYLSPPVGGNVQDFPLGRVSGWVANGAEVPTLEVVVYTKRDVKHSISISPAPDVVAAHPDLKSIRFTIESDCPVLECDLAIQSSDGQVLVPFRNLVRGAPIAKPGLILFVDSATADETASTLSDRRRTIQRKIAALIGKMYSKSSRTLSLLAAIGMLTAIVRIRRRQLSLPFLALALGSIIAVACRVVMLAYLDAVAFPTYYLNYCSPASPFLIVFMMSGICLGYLSLSSHNKDIILQQ